MSAVPAGPVLAVVDERQAGRRTGLVVALLAELAAAEETLVIYGSGSRFSAGHRALVAALRGRLPRHHVVALNARHCAGPLRRDAVAALNRFLDDGSLPIFVIEAAALHRTTAEVASSLRAGRVLLACPTPAGAELHQVWRRSPAPEPLVPGRDVVAAGG